MRYPPRSFSATAATLVAVFALSACGATTYESDATEPAPTTSTTLPTGTPAELLPRLKDTMAVLSSYIGPNPEGHDVRGKEDVLAEIDALWNAISVQVTAESPDNADSISRMVDLAHMAVERKRPADADKAAKFAAQAIDAYLASSDTN